MDGVPGDTAKTFGDKFATYIGCPAGADHLNCLRKLKLEDVMVPYVLYVLFFESHQTQTSNTGTQKSGSVDFKNKAHRHWIRSVTRLKRQRRAVDGQVHFLH